MLRFLVWCRILYWKQIILINLFVWLSLTGKWVYICVKQIWKYTVTKSLSAPVESSCQFRPLDWSHQELDWALSVVDFQEGKDTIFIPFPFTCTFFLILSFILSLTQTCVANVLELEGIWKKEPLKIPSGNLGTILYVYHLRWSKHKECVLEKNLKMVSIEYLKKISSQL